MRNVDYASNSNSEYGSNMCTLSHDQLVKCLEEFIERQAHAHASTVNTISDTAEAPNSSHSAGGASHIAWANDESGSILHASTELLWLEGSLLLLLVEFRRQERLLSEYTLHKDKIGLPKISRAHVAENPMGVKSIGSRIGSTGSGIGGSPAKSLASQMMRALAAEKADLQRRLNLKTSVQVRIALFASTTLIVAKMSMNNMFSFS